MESRKLLGENCDPKRKRKVATKGGDLEECFEVVAADTQVAQQQTSLFWLECLKLQETDKDELLNGEWLTDKHISAISKLLQQQHPEQNGLQDSVQWWRKNTKISIGQTKVRAFNTTSLNEIQNFVLLFSDTLRTNGCPLFYQHPGFDFDGFFLDL